MTTTVRIKWICVTLLLGAFLLSGCSRPESAWSDDFSDPESGWLAESDMSAEVGYQDGVMRILVKTPNSLAWASAQRAFSNFHLTVDATQASGTNDNEYGVLIRMKDIDHFYAFSISGDGYYLVSKYDGERWEALSGEDWSPSDAINHGQATNHLEVLCRGAEMAFIVNDEALARIEDKTYSRGDIGLYAGTFFEPDVEVHFDNLIIEPQ